MNISHRVEKCWFITSSAWRNEAQAATGGVGLLLSSRARKALLRVHYHTNRILSADFDGNPVTTVIVVYSPTNVAQAEEVEKFYEDLATAVRDIPAHNFLAILGCNARLGPEDAPLTYHNFTNSNGEHLAALVMEHELLAANTMFQKRMGKRWTFQDRATGMQRQLDYILVRRRWRNSILNDEPYSTFNSVGSDHRVLSMRVRLSLRVPKPSLKTQYD
ncbi:craniofacial development protein 2-like [Cottoperca gobio]|uniref:Craniofacial development protein 2-like n=1 Tax=Cottoperca gobio TaxID=56716 RepID=A0A6J2PJJ8_COTGO|nr:craniofacial development protein 2-like [Cottoperca gobio]